MILILERKVSGKVLEAVYSIAGSDSTRSYSGSQLTSCGDGENKSLGFRHKKVESFAIPETIPFQALPRGGRD